VCIGRAISDIYFKGNLFGDARPDDEETTAPAPTDLDEWIGTESDAIGVNGVRGQNTRTNTDRGRCRDPAQSNQGRLGVESKTVRINHIGSLKENTRFGRYRNG
jgi:hypothetical protein